MSTLTVNSKSSNPMPPSTLSAPPLAPASVQGPDGDPSMEDIFADIRRTLAEEEAPRVQAQSWPDSSETAPYGVPASMENNVVVLDNSMMVTASTPGPREVIALVPEPAPAASPSKADPVAPAVAADSIGSLVRSMVAERSMVVGGILQPVENIVRDTVRSVIKEWLDANLPLVIERVARVEIERMLGRAG